LYFPKIFQSIWYDEIPLSVRENVMNMVRDVPVYKLYGEEEQWPMPDMVHCESIAVRSQLHNWQIKPHQHHGLFQLLHLREGTARIQLDDRHHQMRAGQVLAVPQMCIHGFLFARHAGGHVVTLAYPLLEKISRQLGDSVAALTGPHVYSLADDDESAQVKLAFNLIDSEYKRDAPYRNLQIESLVGTILVWMIRNSQPAHSEQPRVASRGSRHFGSFCHLVEERYGKHHPVAYYAEKIGITAAHLNVLCRQAANKSALELIHERMLLEAKRSLVYTSMTVSAVSYTLGFSDPAYFTRFFKRRTGFAPKDFRLQAKTVFEQGK
jgi:AraC family transcriptional activator of pobA